MGIKKRAFLAIFLLLFFVLPAVVNLTTDWYWFKSIGFENIFTTILSAKLLIGIITGLAVFAFVYLNFRIADFFSSKETEMPQINKFAEGIKLKQSDINKKVKKFSIVISLMLGFFAGLAASFEWQTVLQYFNSTSFGILDPILNKDISFYFFELPFIKMILGFSFFSVIVSLIGAVLLFALRGAIYFYKGQIGIGKSIKVHFSILVSLLFIIAGLRVYFYKIPELLYSSTGPFTGASYSDISAKLPALKLLMFACFFGALMVILNIRKKGNKLLYAAVALYFIISIIGTGIYPFLVQKFVVVPNELAKESPYIANNISFTRKAFGLDNIEERNLEGETTLTMKDILENQSTIKNVRLWDREPLLDTFGQLQEIRTYYDFVSVDNDRYYIDDEYRQVMLSARELNSESLPHRSFINERFTFTHGFGVTLGPVNQVSQEGLPVLFIKDLPPESSIESLSIERPEIYFGELSNDYVFVKTKAKEFNYPEGEENVFTSYEGDGGVSINSFFRKALFAIRFNSLKILFSDDFIDQSKVLYYRNIKERASRVLPFLEFDKDPYLIITDSGELKWICDAYTTSNRYPYSQFIDISNNSIQPKNINYIKNSLKIVIDAYNGKMQFFVSDNTDPMIKTYAKIFPETFFSLDEMPEDIKAHMRYPEDLFACQTAIYTVYHMSEPQIFYNKEDQWDIPYLTQRGKLDPVMRRIIMKLPEEEKEEFVLMMPFTPKGKDNLSAWIAARNDGENYGKLVVYRFPKQKLVFGPTQVVNRINQDPEISRQISLWDQRGSEVIQGNLLVIPIEGSLLYVRPLYLRAEGGMIPELKRVIVAYENRIAMEVTLQESLQKIFTSQAQEPESFTTESLAEQAQKYFNNALEAQKTGNWALYGQEIEELGKILEKMEK